MKKFHSARQKKKYTSPVIALSLYIYAIYICIFHICIYIVHVYIYAPREFFFLSNLMEYDCVDCFPFVLNLNGIYLVLK